MTQIPAGWYPDPDPDAPEPKGQRYWDGQNWTDHVYPPPGQQPPQPSPPAQPTEPAQPEQPAASSQFGYPAEQAAAIPPDAQTGGYAQAPPPYAPMTPYGGALGPGGPVTPDGQQISGWGRRAGAFLIDWLIRMVVTILVAWPWVQDVASAYTEFLRTFMESAEQGEQAPNQMALMSDILAPVLVISLIGLGINFVYTAGFWKWRAATPGKIMLGLKIRLREQAGPLSWGTVLLRWIGQYWYSLLNLVPVFGFVAGLYPLVDLLWPLWDDKNQALHDKLAKTNVVRSQG